MFYKKLYTLLLVLPMVLMAEITTKVLQQGQDGYDGAQAAGINWYFKTDDRNPGWVQLDTTGRGGALAVGEKNW